MEEVSIERARKTLGEIVDRARIADERTMITRQGKPAAVIVSVEWLKRMRSALSAFADSDDPAVSAREVRLCVVTLAGLLDGMRKIAFTPEDEFRDYWKQLQEATTALADLLPESAEIREAPEGEA